MILEGASGSTAMSSHGDGRGAGIEQFVPQPAPGYCRRLRWRRCRRCSTPTSSRQPWSTIRLIVGVVMPPPVGKFWGTVRVDRPRVGRGAVGGNEQAEGVDGDIEGARSRPDDIGHPALAPGARVGELRLLQHERLSAVQRQVHAPIAGADEEDRGVIGREDQGRDRGLGQRAVGEQIGSQPPPIAARIRLEPEPPVQTIAQRGQQHAGGGRRLPPGRSHRPWTGRAAIPG